MPSPTESHSAFGATPSRPSGLKSIFTSKLHKRVQSTSDATNSQNVENNTPFAMNQMLPADHPHSRAKCPLTERGVNPGSGSSSHSYRDNAGGQGLHKKTKSTISLRSLLGDKDKTRPFSKGPSPEDSLKQKKPKKTKSSTSLSSLFKRSNRGRKDNSSGKEQDKENTAPAQDAEDPPSPFWPHFDRHSSRNNSSRRDAPPRRTLDEELSLYTPRGYSPSKQRNFHDYQPTLTKRSESKPRPKSDLISSNPFLVRDRLGSGQQRWPKEQSALARGNVFGPASSRENQSGQKSRQNSESKRSSRVFAAIPGLGSKEKRGEVAKSSDPKEIDSAFEELLDSRNIPHNMRDKMRSLDTNIKTDFITKHQVENTSASSSGSNRKHRRGLSSRTRNQNLGDIFAPNSDANSADQNKKEPKGRPRSGNFGFSKGAPSRKDARPESVYSHQRQKSGDASRPSSRGSTKPAEMTDPSDFVHYLKEVQKPEIVEVGKLHKLRILLRNETVSWVEAFISCEGMDELIDLLYRIIKVEWREEHEDALLHEVLLCLKGLCTTEPALGRLCDIANVLFPKLLQLLFGEEKKGPSEFTTRGIIISLLFTHLSAASLEQLPSRARTILSYLRDPSQPEESQPLSFIANIYQTRPYSVWCRESSNVTKEVFWIFLHHLNVVPRERSEDFPAEEFSIPFAKKYYPPPHPPVPAAPYIGGVEWDATNYLANHVDLINGLIASLPAVEERNSLRSELRASGFEKVMGRSLRTCKEKLYPAIHEGLKTWVAAAARDGWEYQFVREGPPRDAPDSTPCSPIKGGGAMGSPKKKGGIVSEAPPKLDLKVGVTAKQKADDTSAWI